MARASKDANMKPQNEINEKHCFKLNLTDYYEFILFRYPRELCANLISLFSDDTLIRWKAGCGISILFVDFSAKPMLKSLTQISLKDEHYKLPPTSLQSSTGKLQQKVVLIKYCNSINQHNCVGWLIKAGFPYTVSYKSFDTRENTIRYVKIRLVFCFVRQSKTTVNFQNLLRTMENGCGGYINHMVGLQDLSFGFLYPIFKSLLSPSVRKTSEQRIFMLALQMN